MFFFLLSMYHLSWNQRYFYFTVVFRVSGKDKDSQKLCKCLKTNTMREWSENIWWTHLLGGCWPLCTSPSRGIAWKNSSGNKCLKTTSSPFKTQLHLPSYDIHFFTSSGLNVELSCAPLGSLLASVTALATRPCSPHRLGAPLGQGLCAPYLCIPVSCGAHQRGSINICWIKEWDSFIAHSINLG